MIDLSAAVIVTTLLLAAAVWLILEARWPVVIAGAIVVLTVAAVMAHAHGFYSTFCCSDRDCAPVAPDAITCTPEGCDVTVVPGEHPSVPVEVNGGKPVIFHGTRPPEISPDGQNHACIVGSTLRCVYVGGSV